MTKNFYNHVLIEAVAQTFHNLQQKEAQRQGNESPITYYELAEENKEYIRVVARFVVDKLDDMIDVTEFYANQSNWTTISEDKGRTTIKDGIIFDDMGEKAREILRKIGLDR